MKTNINMKQSARKAAVSTVHAIAAPLHIVLQLTSNVAQVMADGIALGEGRAVEAIDYSIDRETTANNRVLYTQDKFMQTAIRLQHIKDKLQASIDAGSSKIKQMVNHHDIEVNQEQILSNLAQMNAEIIK